MNEIQTSKEIEAKWQKYWKENNCFKTVEDENKEKYYAGNVSVPVWKAHMGHVRTTPSET